MTRRKAESWEGVLGSITVAWEKVELDHGDRWRRSRGVWQQSGKLGAFETNLGLVLVFLLYSCESLGYFFAFSDIKMRIIVPISWCCCEAMYVSSLALCACGRPSFYPLRRIIAFAVIVLVTDTC